MAAFRPGPIFALESLEDRLERYRRLWEERLERLRAYLRQLQAKDKKRKPKP